MERWTLKRKLQLAIMIHVDGITYHEVVMMGHESTRQQKFFKVPFKKGLCGNKCNLQFNMSFF